jgi:hypothetical protein
MLDTLKDSEAECEVFEEINLETIVKNILSFISRKDFEKCPLLNKVLICVWQLTESDNLKPHPYTITRCINKVRGKSTSLFVRGRVLSFTASPPKNEGYKQRKIEDCLSHSDHANFFIKSEDSPQKQGMDSQKKLVIGWEINHNGIISYLETEYLHYCLIKRCSNHGISPSAKNEAINEAIIEFHGELQAQEIETIQNIYIEKLQTLINQKYFEFAENGFLKTPASNRKSNELHYLKYLYKNAIKQINLRKESISQNLNLTGSNSNG